MPSATHGVDLFAGAGQRHGDLLDENGLLDAIVDDRPVPKPTLEQANVREGQEALRPRLVTASIFWGDYVPPDPPVLPSS